MAGADISAVEVLGGDQLDEVRPLLLDLMEGDQERYDHHRLTREEIDRQLLGTLATGFQGENVMLAVRESGEVIALCWCVIFNPGTGLEGEVAEVYVRPEQRGRGLARKLLQHAVQLFQERGVTFATVWTHPSNKEAASLYASAGFRPTEQLVMTWLPEDG